VIARWRRVLVLPSACFGQLLLATSLVLLLPACGYHVGGQGAALPPDIKTIAVPAFRNDTQEYRIEQKLTSAVVRELIERTQFRVTTHPRDADAVLYGTVKRIFQGVVTLNPRTGSATALQLTVVAGVRLVDKHTGKVVFFNPDYVFREQYQISQAASTLIEEDPAAIDRLSQDFARTLVTDILENF
jgi:outer membrane lipopolysaccharide assembly protein LptE/RlpB